MRSMRAADVPAVEGDPVFGHSRARALGLVVASIGAAAGLLWLGRRQGSGLAYYVAAVILLGLVGMQRFILARFRPSNWLVRMTGDGLFVQVRSHLNHQFPQEDRTVIFIPYGEIRSARLVRERRTIASREVGRRVETESEQRRSLVELDLTGDPAPLAQALAEEAGRLGPRGAGRHGAVSTRYKHHPVRIVSPRVLHLEWSVAPGAEAFLEALRGRTDVAPPVDLKTDLAHLEGLGRDEQEERLRELAETGRTVEAIRMARKLYAYDLARARAYVESLRGGSR